MPDTVSPTVVALLYSVVALLVVLVLLGVGVLRRLARIDKHLAANSLRRESAGSAATPPETEAAGAFEDFLNEDPTRRTMTKGEQFAAYRQWRQEHGMNWSHP